jgi:hypothetical protein
MASDLVPQKDPRVSHLLRLFIRPRTRLVPVVHRRLSIVQQIFYTRASQHRHQPEDYVRLWAQSRPRLASMNAHIRATVNMAFGPSSAPNSWRFSRQVETGVTC